MYLTENIGRIEGSTRYLSVGKGKRSRGQLWSKFAAAIERSQLDLLDGCSISTSQLSTSPLQSDRAIHPAERSEQSGIRDRILSV